MAIGLDIGNNVRVELGEFKEQVLKDLNDSDIRYTIPFDKTTANNIKETIVTVSDMGIEISIENDIVTYIKSASNEYSTIDNIAHEQDINVLEHINKIKKIITNKFNSEDDEYTIKFEKIDTTSMNMVIILSGIYERARITILMDGSKNVYINTIRQLV